MIAVATFALLVSSGDAFSIQGKMRSDTSLQMAGSKKKIVITGMYIYILNLYNINENEYYLIIIININKN